MSEFGSTETGEAREQLCADTLRVLAMDAVQKANSGHPGMPMGMADVAHVLWSQVLRLDPQDPDWIARDRFVLSAGHGSMLLYGLLHLSGHDLPMEQLKQFRQLHSKTPGHPENFVTRGVETTTGPLGQGVGNAVGMALAERHLVARFPQAAEALSHRTFAIAGDGDLMEGVASEAASLAGHLGLGRLVVLYDDNKITIDGSTDIAFTEDVLARFEAYGWNTARVDGHDRAAVKAAIDAACAQDQKPTLIACRTVIGKGSPNKANSSKSHGSPLGAEELKLTKEGMGWPQDPFLVPPAVRQRWSERQAEWQSARAAWNTTWSAVPEGDRTQLTRWFKGEVDLAAVRWPEFEVGKKLATRAASGKVLQALVAAAPNLIGGSADLAGSNNTDIDGDADYEKGAYGARNLRFGVREHGMGAIVNGMALHGGVIPYAATFLVFSDYCRPSIRLSALMHTRVVWVMTHDSVFLGEDGPTHQPVEHLMALRTIPNLRVFRPADANETAESWRLALEHDGPSLLALTRQGLPTLDRGTHAPASGTRRGGYVLWESTPGTLPQAILIATGSEVPVALEVAQRLHADDGVPTRVVSLPCWKLFAEQPSDYREEVLPARCGARVSIEAGSTFGWERYTGDLGLRIGIDTFGASAPAEELAEHFGLSVDKVLARTRGYLHDMAVAHS
ncbi:MAG: transketolase [Planctomycetes bacterium]|nr:transketolase [Planctomycetota bacterium]